MAQVLVTQQNNISHVLVNREHNRIARSLGQNNPYWDDEKIFQQARMIVTAQIQVGDSQIFFVLSFIKEIVLKHS